MHGYNRYMVNMQEAIFMIVNGCLFVLMVFCCYLTIIAFCFPKASTVYQQVVQNVNQEQDAVDEGAITTQEETGMEGEETTVPQGVFIMEVESDESDGGI